MKQTIKSLLPALNAARHVVILSGAGLSADSGIPTFRDGATGLWAGIDPLEVASIDGFERDPEKVWGWHQAMRRLFAEVRPNSGHWEIAGLEALLPNARITVITQNIDGLHQTAGSTRVLEIHGSALRIRCHRHCGFVAAWDGGEVARRCPACAAPVRPDVVWFGEALDDAVFGAAADVSAVADVYFSVGTSAIVQPAASLPMLARENGAVIAEINPHETPFTPFAMHSLRTDAASFFREVNGALSDR